MYSYKFTALHFSSISNDRLYGSYESSDSDMEVLDSASGDQNRIVQGLKKSIKRKQKKIHDLTAKLIISENNLACEKEKTKDKEDVIKSLKLSIDAIKDNFGQSLKKIDCDLHETKIDELNANIEILECKLKNRNEKIAELEDKMEKYETNLKEKSGLIAELESVIKIAEDSALEDIRTKEEKDEQIAKLESQAKVDASMIKKLNDKLSTFTLKVEPSDDSRETMIYLNCTKMTSIQFVKLPKLSFAAVFEDLPSAGPGWMLIQRRIDGSVVPLPGYRCSEYFNGFGDLSREFWLGYEKLHILTTNQRHELYIELVDFDNATAYARYDHFEVGSDKEHYALKKLGQYSGSAGDYLTLTSSCQQFVVDKNEDIPPYEMMDYGWWENTLCNLNGKYYGYKKVLESPDGIWWGTWNMGKRHSLKSCKMLIRPRP
ncbi:fibrinogen-like protein 1 isoform X2 [Drosophila serrata]|uniref:fibrinogen-like protein 1 isoform X2 n=1 Tax=Drosophila serrata TaxID=7274 RepID=UPI000A1D37D9|nr:fibrinogen-like protein 1 isoform X2 [Drosophila serrata]